ncbi:uncharacterized protein PAC_19394 [Phialocephala subalpina]|uniref:Uncharacterized protein n=1 Tax=Phialocephala subalpina TaxID=576137 RepID=A0A1L7XWT4_9HELO|nr:uncharacterized protein PAC_19394 [Phialocephala subalpina]
MNFSVAVPPNAQNHGDPGLICLPPVWTDYFIFFATNYIAHAATLITHPGESLQETLIATANALFIPGSGALRAFRFLVLYLSPRLTRIERRTTPLGQAARAGALCMVVDERIISDAMQETEGTPRFFFGENIREVPRDRTIYGVCKFPEPGPRVPKYRLVEVPPNMPLRPWETHALSAAAGALDSDSSDTEPVPVEMQLSKNYNIPKILISILQILWGIVTLYKTRGNQIALYGCGAFGLTVAPYAIMSIINLATNLLRPEYATMYLVHSPEMGEAALHEGAEFRGIVASLDDNRTYAEDFTGALNIQSDNLLYFIFNLLGYLVIAILPIAIVGGYTHFQSGSNVKIQISWIIGWLIIGCVSTLWVRISAVYAATVHPLWEVVLVIPLWIPAIGGFVVVAEMLKDFGICTSFDR